ncbi:uncharacterized protein LOC109817286 [Cajanus cajan]|uniref:uncharacterized protein LOC109817286 n=1 Tax=Cajanus cajan TaxID=3821 RepID=UPI00098DBA69|nr:uncharacterized protein LOC109817286 [Cajanus cajan]
MDQPTTTGRVFALTGVEAEMSSELVKGKGKADGNDLGRRVKLTLERANSRYPVVTNTEVCSFRLERRVKLSLERQYSHYPVVRNTEVCNFQLGRRVKLTLERANSRYQSDQKHGDLDVILGMDWHSANRIFIDYSKRRLIFPTVEQERFISSGQVDGLLKGGALGFIVLSFISLENEKLLNSIDVVRDFPEVFPDDVPGLPLKGELEFSFDLIPGAGPVSISPYRMAPAELS